MKFLLDSFNGFVVEERVHRTIVCYQFTFALFFKTVILIMEVIGLVTWLVKHHVTATHYLK